MKELDIEQIKTYSLTETAKIFGVCHRTVFRWVQSGRLQAVKIGRTWRVSRAEIDRATREGLRDPVKKEGGADGSEQG